ncbi:hypothetical protein V5F77_02620 [Xanthobacter sp. DSM 24535]|uniref:hypothetical protein n=1 Tax=Roseixanthobacter psychrophilus TaxID=3119917 RepID=UPI00372CBFF2
MNDTPIPPAKAAYRLLKTTGLHRAADWPSWSDVPGIISGLTKSLETLASFHDQFARVRVPDGKEAAE